jgi:superfamily I DNA/RNA helicase
MNKLSFEYFLNLKEMSVATFGKNKGKHINDIDRGYAKWMLDKIKEGGPTSFNFLADDGSGSLSKTQVEDALKIVLSGQKVAPTSTKEPIKAIAATSMPPAIKEPGSVEPEVKPAEKPAEKPLSSYLIPADKISDYQKKIEEAFANSNKHLVINALAGTGKSTVLKHLAAKFSSGKKWLYIVFNRKNADEATSGSKAFPPNVETMTSHKFLAKVLEATRKERPGLLPSSKPTTGSSDEGEDFGNKLTKILDHWWFYNLVSKMESSLSSSKQGYLTRYNRKRNRKEVAYALKNKINKIVSLAKNFAINPNKSDAYNKIKEIIKKYNITGELYESESSEAPSTPDFTEEYIDLSLSVLKATAPTGSINDRVLDSTQDFDDIIWWPTLHPEEMVWPTSAQYEVALVDEVQDFNNAQKVMLENLAKNGIRIVVVGDPQQSIYRFRGADAQGFSNIESLLKSSSRGASTHDLPVNYRSGKKIIDHVNKTTHVKDLKAGLSHEGEVNPDADQENLVSQVENEFSKNGSLNQETAFIARNNAPLFEVSLRLLKNNIPFQIVGKDFSNEILNFIYRVVGKDKIAIGKLESKNMSLNRFVEEMENYLQDKVEKYENKKDKEKYLEELEKMHAAMIGLISHLESEKTGGLEAAPSPPSERQSSMSVYGYQRPRTTRKSRYYDHQIYENQQNIQTVEDLCNHIKNLFKGLDPRENKRDAEVYDKIDKKKTVILTTAHKSKGLEFERVNIISDELFPPETTKDADEEKQQEQNAKYVAYTRATHTLNISKSKK